jgi:RNA polymerase sigma-70 factor (ECF subfamily)
VEDHERRLRLEALYTQHAAAVHAYARRRTDIASAEEVVMEVFVIACRRLELVPAQPLPWLLGCGRRLLANQRRGAQRAEALIEWLASAATRTVSEDATNELVAAALAELNERAREILLLSSWRTSSRRKSPRCSAAPGRRPRCGFTEPASGWAQRSNAGIARQ